MKSLRKVLSGLSLIILLCGGADSQTPQEQQPQPPETENALPGVRTNDAHKFIISVVLCHRPVRASMPPTSNNPVIYDLTLSKTEMPANSSGEDSKIEVSTKAFDWDEDFLLYQYVITGGKITGQGEKVVWDLSGVKPGIYRITVGADDGCGFCGNTLTKEVKIVE